MSDTARPKHVQDLIDLVNSEKERVQDVNALASAVTASARALAVGNKASLRDLISAFRDCFIEHMAFAIATENIRLGEARGMVDSMWEEVDVASSLLSDDDDDEHSDECQHCSSDGHDDQLDPNQS